MKIKNYTLRHNSGEVLGFGPQDYNKMRVGLWKYFHKNGQLWQFGKYNSKGKRVRDTWRYFDEEGKEY